MPTPKNSHPKLILASGSAYRQGLLARVSSNFSCISPDIDESCINEESPAGLALRLAVSKAQAVADSHPGAIVIGSDQVAALGNQVLGKPGGHKAAARQLSACSGQAVIFYTAVHICHPELSFAESHVDETTVRFRELSGAEIDAYLEAEKPWDCAGSFKSEGLGITLFEAIENQDPTALIGLPMIWVSGCLRRAGIKLPAA